MVLTHQAQSLQEAISCSETVIHLDDVCGPSLLLVPQAEGRIFSGGMSSAGVRHISSNALMVRFAMTPASARPCAVSCEPLCAAPATFQARATCERLALVLLGHGTPPDFTVDIALRARDASRGNGRETKSPLRHARIYSGHPRSFSSRHEKSVDGRDEPGHDE